MHNNFNIIRYRIADCFVLLFYKLFSNIGIRSKIRVKHLDNNKKAWSDYKMRYPHDRFIEHQAGMGSFLYGKRYNADYNSCEIIAVYNALVKLEINRFDFPYLIEWFEKKGNTIGGAFGTSPYAIIKFFKSQGFTVTFIKFKEWIKNNNFIDQDAFILITYNNAKTIKDMIHSMCITKEDNYYQMHNDYEGSKCYSSLENAVNGYKGGNGRMIMLIGISKR